MIDTIKFLVPINAVLLQDLKQNFTQIKKEDLKTKVIDYELYTSNLKLGKHKKNVSIKISDNRPIGLFIELSITKYRRGNNVEMIHPENLGRYLFDVHEEVSSCLNYKLPHFSKWEIYRLDVCYNWIFKDLDEAKTIMGFIQRIDYPRKKKYLYDTSVMYKGSSYTIKFYLKGPEFIKNDFKELRDVNETEAIELAVYANRIVRFEITFKKKQLKTLFNQEPIFFECLIYDNIIEKILHSYLNDKVFKYITIENTTEAKIEEILYSNFTKGKATRLFQFYKNYFLEDGAIKRRINSGGIDRSTVYRYKKELKKLGVGFDIVNSNGESLIESLVIPSSGTRFDLVGVPEHIDPINALK